MAWAVLKSGRLMPCEVVFDGEEWKTIKTPAGAEYTYPKDRIIPEEDGEMMLREQRIQDVVDTRRFEIVSRLPLIVRVHNPAHPRKIYVITQEGFGRLHCTCKAFARDEEHACKHVEAFNRIEAQERKPVPAKRPVGGVKAFASGEW